ncbi:MAG: hypothetical protein AAGF12_27420 [Myxococcota bacterium]
MRAIAILTLISLASCGDDSSVRDVTPDGSRSEAGAADAMADAAEDAPLDAASDRDLDAPSDRDLDAPSDSDLDAGDSAPDGVVCDPRQVLCDAIPPDCPQGRVPEVVQGCWGNCVDIGECACSDPAACPEPNLYTCINFRMRCSPFL